MWRLTITFEDPRGGARFLSFSGSSRQKFCKMVLNRLAPPPKVSAPGKSWIHHWLDVLFFFLVVFSTFVYCWRTQHRGLFFSLRKSYLWCRTLAGGQKSAKKSPNAYQMSRQWGEGMWEEGGGGFELLFFDFRFDHLKSSPPPLAPPELKLPMESFDIADTLLYTRRLPSWFFWFL